MYFSRSRVSFIICILYLILPSTIYAENSTDSQFNLSRYEWYQTISEGTGFNFKTLGYGVGQMPADSKLNPDNFLEISSYQTILDMRLDLKSTYKRLFLSAKPRFWAEWIGWEEGSLEGETETDTDLYVNEWLARFRMLKGAYISYGRENLQWGPSYTISPSNPFFRDNGQANPKQEVPGQDFARFIWVISPKWTSSLIANTDEGRQEYLNGFNPVYAFKVDYTGYRKYFSLIGSYRENDRFHLGAFTGWTVSDGLLIYAEVGDLSQGTNAYYPVTIEEPGYPGTIQMVAKNEDADSLEGTLLLGTSYTFEQGPTITSEYIFNSPGYSENDADLYYSMLDQIFGAQAISGTTTINESNEMLSPVLDPGLRLLRRNYLMIQYLHTNIHNVLNITLRYLYNMDDHSSRFNPIIQYDIGDRLQLFAVGNQNFGPDNTEFTSLVDYSWMIGVELSF